MDLLLRLIGPNAGKEVYDEKGELSAHQRWQLDRINAITGQQFKTEGPARAWFADNQYFLRWNPDTRQLLLDAEAKARGEYVLDTLRKSSVRGYWSARATGYIRTLGQQGDALVYKEFFPTVPPSICYVSRDALRADSNLKFALELCDDWVDWLRDHDQPEETRAAGQIVQKVQRLTGRFFATPAECVVWWDEHRENLRVSDDGEHLVVGSWLDKLLGK